MIDKLKEAAVTKGMQLMSDPRVMKLMSDPRFMNFVTKALEFQGKVSATLSEATNSMARMLNLASRQEFEELKEELLALRERLETVEKTKS